MDAAQGESVTVSLLMPPWMKAGMGALGRVHGRSFSAEVRAACEDRLLSVVPDEGPDA